MIHSSLALGIAVQVVIGLLIAGSPGSQAVKSNAEMKRLDFLLGSWKGTETPSGGPDGKTPATISGDRVLGGTWLQLRERSGSGATATSNLRMLTYDPESKMYTAEWFSADRPTVVHFSGNFNGDTLILLSKPIPAASATTATYRATWAHPKKDQLTFLLEIQIAGKWTPVTECHYNKAKS